jgi:hypothetical protein
MEYIKKSAGICEMCGHHVAVRQKAHIFAEGKKATGNLLYALPFLSHYVRYPFETQGF